MRSARDRIRTRLRSHFHHNNLNRRSSAGDIGSRPCSIPDAHNKADDTNHQAPDTISINLQTCTTCLKDAIRPAIRGPDINSIRKAGQLGCVRCATIAHGLDKFKHLYEVKPDQDVSQHSQHVHFMSPRVIVSTMGLNLVTNRVYAERYEFCFNIAKDLSNPVPDLLVPEGVLLNSKTAACFDNIRTWTETCESSHVRCATKATPECASWLPSRLISIRDVRVVLRSEIADQTAKYAALSHCWGTPNENSKPLPRTLNQIPDKSLDSRRRLISWDELTVNFQDAIIVARNLGYEYLWIDSLCIIQDDEDDWTAEAAMMAHVYGNANIVISATRSASGDGGLFSSRAGATVFDVPELGGLAVTIRQRPKHANFFTSHKPDFSQDPVFRRGWCFQERLLAKRIVHFTEQEVVWECSEALRCECGTIETEAFDRREGNHDKQFKTRFDTMLHSNDLWEQNSCWLNIIEGYAARELTKESDRLPALSGIAQKLQSSQRGRYFAGHWEGTLPNSLLWYLHFGDPKIRQSIKRLPNIPTWAWPSVATSITPHFQNSAKHLTLTTVTKVIDVYCELTTVNPYGEIQGGFLLLQGPVKEVSLQPNEVEGMKTLMDVNDHKSKIRFMPDSYIGLPSDGSRVWCIGIELDVSEWRQNGFLCLVLKESDVDSSEYKRIGQANCLSSWAKSAKQVTLRIV